MSATLITPRHYAMLFFIRLFHAAIIDTFRRLRLRCHADAYAAIAEALMMAMSIITPPC